MAADVQATVAALQAQLRSLKCPLRLDAGVAEAGSPAPYLQALSWLLLHFSKHVALLVTQQGLQLRGASDMRFAEGVLRFARDALALRPSLSAAQLLADGQFARAKAALVLDVARACKERHNAAARQERLAALKACHAEQRLYGTAAAPASATGAPAEQQQVGRPTARSSGIPRPPPPHVRVVSGAAQQQQAAAAAAAAAKGDCAAPAATLQPDEELCSEGSDGGPAHHDATTPTSVVAAAGAGAPGKQQAASQPPAAVQRRDASPADRPRALPPALLTARPAEAQQQSGTLVHTSGVVGSTQSCALPVASYPQVLAAAPGTQVPLLLPPGETGRSALDDAAQPSAVKVLPQQLPHQQPQQQVQQLPQPLPAPAGQCTSLAIAAMPTTACIGSTLTDQQTRRLIEELQLRLGLAEEAAAAARQEAQAAREQLQARVTILEGRVRFLEAGFELRPPHQSQPPLLLGSGNTQGQPQPPLALPAPAAAAAAGTGIVATSAAGGCFGSLQLQLGSTGGTGAAGWRGQAPAAPSSAAWQPQRPEHTLPPPSLQQHARVNPLFESQQPQAVDAAPAFAGWQHAEVAVHRARAAAPSLAIGSSNSAAHQPAEQPLPQADKQQALQPPLQSLPQVLPPAAQQGMAAAALGPAAVASAATNLSGSGSAAELIRSMQARFSEADDFLLSLRRL